jgi:hypothetical protein
MQIQALLIACGASLVLSVADKVPEFDVSASCKAVAGFGLTLSHSPEACISDENAAHAELKQKWDSYPVAVRNRCVDETMIGSPSYVDILTCLQMTQDAEALNSPLVGASKRKRGIK